MEKWYRNAAVYQIYPRSFYDSNGDGIGDLAGITEKLPYIKDLGASAIWLSPFYPSPMIDFGYDVCNYNDVDPIFGTIADFDGLVAAAHESDIRVFIDYIPNHTSHLHPWFIESRSSKNNPKRDWYIWKENEGEVPNNWLSVFGGSGWELDPITDCYYFHSFLKEQPDLNWRNPQVQNAMKNVLRFWLDRGVDGFRIDAIYFMYKDPEFRDNPLNPNYQPGIMDPYQTHLHTYSFGLPETLDMLKEFCDVLGEYKDTFMVSEVYAPVPDLIPFFKICSPRIHSPFNMNLISMPWDAVCYREHIEEIEENLTMEDTPNYVLGNHDRSRVATRLGPSRARLLAFLQLTLRGMPFIYYGDEIGMEDVPIKSEDAQDPWEKNVPGMGFGRDPARTPMQWSAKKFAGFSSAKPWLPIAENYVERNVEAESKDASSMLNVYKTLLKARKDLPALHHGAYSSITTDNHALYAFERVAEEEKLIIILNFSDQEQPVHLLGIGEVIATTDGRPAETTTTDLNSLVLQPFEGYLVRLS
jgi:alpha-glucosidase